ncbi:MAG: hypothetical protein ACXABY_29845, partial [Candidatus Thorarchaeota archaeon]|jgi:hypothetical protein
VSADGDGNRTDLFLFMRNIVKNSTGAVHVSSEAGGIINNAAVIGNVFFNAAICTSVEGYAPGFINANNAYILPPSGIQDIKSNCQNSWDVSGGTTWLSWKNAGSNYLNNYVGLGVPNWRLLWMNHKNMTGLRSNKAQNNVIDYEQGTYACYGVGPNGGSVLPNKLTVGQDVLPFLSPSENVLRKNPVPDMPGFPDINFIEDFVRGRAADDTVGPHFDVLGTCHGRTPAPSPGPTPTPTPDILERLIRIEEKIDQVPALVRAQMAAWYNR